jgi:hypothetical protein
MSLNDYTMEELQQEIARRNEPEMHRLARPDSAIVKDIWETVNSCIQEALEEDYWDDNNDQYIYEAVMTAFFGPEYDVYLDAICER